MVSKMKRIEMHRLILTGMCIPNIEDGPGFGAYKNMSLSTLEWEQGFDEKLTVYLSDIGWLDPGEILTISLIENQMTIRRTISDNVIEVFVAETGDFTKAIKLQPNEDFNLKRGDIPLILVRNYFPLELYDGAEALFQLRIIDEV